jgi:hypothetical protein
MDISDFDDESVFRLRANEAIHAWAPVNLTGSATSRSSFGASYPVASPPHDRT